MYPSYEEEIKNTDGSKIIISVRCYDAYGKMHYNVEVSTKEKGKRKWLPAVNTDCYEFRGLSMEDRAIFKKKVNESVAGKDAIYNAKLKLWEKLKPEE